jgi:hypothetical protein
LAEETLSDLAIKYEDHKITDQTNKKLDLRQTHQTNSRTTACSRQQMIGIQHTVQLPTESQHPPTLRNLKGTDEAVLDTVHTKIWSVRL